MDPQTSFDQIIPLLTRSFAELEAQAMHEGDLANLSMRQVVFLESIARMERPTFSDLARLHAVTKPSVTAIVGKLIQKGFVEKVQSPDDRRSFYLLLTEKGQALAAVHDRIHHHIAQTFTTALEPAELETLGRLLHKVMAGLLSGRQSAP
jgi:DNA-binding MarR family transcriptional regulator